MDGVLVALAIEADKRKEKPEPCHAMHHAEAVMEKIGQVDELVTSVGNSVSGVGQSVDSLAGQSKAISQQLEELAREIRLSRKASTKKPEYRMEIVRDEAGKITAINVKAV